MSQLHIIGVGGTGHKMVSAAVHLAACGAFKGNLGKHRIDKIRVLTIDADDSNGNLLYTKNVLSAYHNYYTAVNGASSLGLIPVEPVSEKINLPLFLQGKDSISKAFNIPQYAGKDEDAFIRFLYTDDEINEDFQHGFYGHTSIGTLIVKDILSESAVWRSYLPEINAGDFVVVIGSIFGGTGASAIPVLLDELSAKKRQTAFNLAALVLNPYFQTVGEIQQEGLLQPDSGNFNIKARAALYYYYTQSLYRKTNALYVIGEPQTNFSIERASRGATDQRNKAAPIELFAATALIDFIRKSDDRGDSGIIAAQRAVGDGKYLYTWDMLQNALPNLPKNIQTALKTAIFYNKIIYPELQTETASVYQSYYDNLGGQRDQNQNFIYDNIHKYLNQLVDWFYDLHKCNRTDVNQNTGALMWDPDPRVKLFNAQYHTLFDDVPVGNADIKDFDETVCADTNKKKSLEVFNHISGKKPQNGKDFAALLGLIYDFIAEEKKGLFAKKAPPPEKFDMAPYLSKENNATFAIPASPNELWAKSQPALLSSIADGLPTSVSQTFTKNDISIPSPWSIFIMNELTLTEPKFAGINKNAYNEWCGIIALLVLRKVCLYEKQGLHFEALQSASAGSGDFFSVVDKTLVPQSCVFSDPNWKQSHRLSIDVDYPLGTKQVTLAFLANNTLVCPAYSFDEATLDKLNAIAPDIVNDARQFRHPADYFIDQSKSLNRDAKYVLKQFLSELALIITREAAQNKLTIIKHLQKLVDQFNTDLGAATANTNLALDPQKKSQVKSVTSLFEELCVAPSKTNQELPFIMEGAKERAALIGTTISGVSSSSSDAASLLITENLMFNQINAASIAAYNNTKRDGIKLVYADELLLDSMILIKKDGAPVFHALSNASSLTEYDIIWPLNSVLLDLYTTDALNKMVSLSSDGENVTVSLKIKLGSALGGHTINKEYRMKQLSQMTDADKNSNGLCWIMEKNLVPFWSLWPYTRINDTNGSNTWQRYNCFCIELQYRGLPVLDIKPVFNSSVNVEERALSTLQSQAMSFYYRRCRDLPVAFTVSEKTDGAPIPRGIVFLAEAKSVNAGAVRWNVGIDFGTTSTTAFYTTSGDSTPRFIQVMPEYEWKEGSADAKRYEFNNDIVKLCNNGDESSELYFIDNQCFRQNGFATALEIMDNSQMSSDATLFTETRNFWHNHDNFKVLNTQEGRKERLLTNIKWESNKSNSAKYLNQLLTHIVYQAAEKGVRTVNFYFSYPTAFGPGAKDDFCARISGIITLLAEETGIALTFDDNYNLVTESIAAAYYFNHKKPLQTVFFCVDIGGGSTDASIWVKTKHLFQTSIHFASRDMFIKPLSRLFNIPSVLKMVTTNSPSDGIYTMLSDVSSGKALTGDKFKFLIETVLFEYYTPLVNRLQNMQGQDAQAFKSFKYCVLITYSGLIYYLAHILASLFTIKDEKRKIDNDICEVILGLSGKGSKLTGWIKSYCNYIYGEAQDMIKEKTKLDIRILPEFSPETAKTETAIGMICNLDADGKQKNQAALIKPDLYMGGEITVLNSKDGKTKPLHADDFVDTYNDPFFSSPKSLKVEFDKELPELEAFIAFFNRITAKTGNEMPPLDTAAFNKMKKSLWNKIKNECENTLTEGRFEPPFILMLKVFLEDYAEEFLWKK